MVKINRTNFMIDFGLKDRVFRFWGRGAASLPGLAILVALLMASFSARAIDVYEFENDQDRDRYLTLTTELRCPKCQNQNLADSNSQISIDLRAEVFRLLEEGKSNAEVKEFMVSRYGDFVLYRPPVQSNTLFLWAGPGLMLLLGFGVFGFILWRRAALGDAGDDTGPADENVLVSEGEASELSGSDVVDESTGDAAQGKD